MQIANDKVVSIHYTLTNDSNQVLDSSQGGDPLVYLHGAGNIIPGLENALAGKQKGDKLKVRIEPKDAYGDRDENLKQVVGKSQFPPEENIEVGMAFQAHTPQGPMILHVVSITGEEVTVDANHPLAGQHLNFDVAVDDVRAATQEELDHGHVHGAGGHPH